MAVEKCAVYIGHCDEESQAHFDAVRRQENLRVDYIIDTNMVRGLDYTTTRFSSLSAEIEGNNLTVCAGGR